MTTSNSNTANANQSNNNEFINIRTEIVAYVNRPRIVQPKQGNPYPAVTLNAMVGKTGDMNYRRIEALPKGEKLISLFTDADLLARMTADGAKVVVCAVVGDIAPELDTNKQTGEQYLYQSARLIAITSLKINGKHVDHPGITVKKSKEDDQAPAQQAPEAPAPAAQAPAAPAPAQNAAPESANSAEVLTEVELNLTDADYPDRSKELQDAGYSFSQPNPDDENFVLAHPPVQQ